MEAPLDEYRGSQPVRAEDDSTLKKMKHKCKSSNKAAKKHKKTAKKYKKSAKKQEKLNKQLKNELDFEKKITEEREKRYQAEAKLFCTTFILKTISDQSPNGLLALDWGEAQ